MYNRNKGNNNKKQTNLIRVIILAIMTVNVAPLMSYGVEVRDMPEDELELIERETEEGVEGGEEKQEDEEHGEESGGLSLPDEVIGEEEGAYESTEEDKLEGEKETDIIEDKETNGSYGTQTTSLMMQPQSENNYVMAKDSDFTWEADQWGSSYSPKSWMKGSYVYTGTDEYVEIPHVIQGHPVTSYYRMFANNETVKGVKSTNKNIKHMDAMFSRYKGDTLDLSQLDTSGVEDFGNMFSMAEIGNLDVSTFNTSKVKTMANMFKNSTIPHIDLRSFDTSSVHSMYSMFYGTDSKIIDVSSFNTSNVNDMNSMFYQTTVETLDLTNFDTGNVIDMSYMFEGSQSKNIDVSSFNTSKVTTMDSMFKGTHARELLLGSFNTGNVTNMNSMFVDSKATKIDVTRFDTSNVNNMTEMFRGSNAEELDLRSFNTQRINDMSNFFEGSKAKKINVDNFNTRYVLRMENMFKDTQVDSLDLSSFDMSSVNDYGGMFEGSKVKTIQVKTNKDGDKLRRWEGLPSEVQLTTKYELATDEDYIGTTNGNFKYVGDKEYVEIPHQIIGVNVTSYRGMFENTSVKGVISSNKQITDMSRMFRNTTSTDLDVSSIDTSSVVNMESMFENSLAEDLDLRNFETTKVENMGSMFKSTKLTEIDLGSFNLNNVTNTKDMLNNTTAVSGYARTQEDLDKLQGSTNKPTTLNLKVFGVTVVSSPSGWTNGTVELIPEAVGVNGKITDNAGNTETVTYTVSNIDRSLVVVTTTVDNNNWTNKPINIKVTSEDSSSKLENIEMNNSPIEGRNLVLDSGKPKKTTTEYLIGDYMMSRPWKEGQEYVSTVHGDVNEGQVMGIWFNGASSYQAHSKKVGDRIHQAKFKGKAYIAPNGTVYGDKWYQNEVFRVYNVSESGARFGEIDEVKLEMGTKATPWTPAPEDIKLINNSKTYPVVANGLYTFEAKYQNGVTSEVSVNITNIDLDAPTIEVLNNPEDWTEEDEIVLEINVSDNNQSGVKVTTLPNGETTTDTNIKYAITENGDYDFIVEDNVGNKETYTVTVDKMMIPYFFYIYDSKGEPLTGAGFELIRDGVVHKTATSDVNGLVDFGKVPPTGNYTIRQTKAPDGYIVDPEEKDVDVEDDTDPIEIINYPRGTEMPSTGTISNIIIGLTVIGTMAGLVVVINKKSRRVK